jgi:glycopeptide antibiotics resistance protein
MLYIILVGWLTLTPRPGTPNTAPDWIPYASLKPVVANLWIVTRHPEYLEFIDLEALKHVVGNVLLFIPLGWLLPVLWDGPISAGRIVAVAASTSLTVELWQLSIPGRMTTVDDVILNALGAGIGAMTVFWVERMFARQNGHYLRF